MHKGWIAAVAIGAMGWALLGHGRDTSMTPTPSTPASNTLPSAPAIATGFLHKTLESGGVNFKHVVYVPRGYTASKNWPCILFLHGRGECGSDGLKQVAQGLGQAILANEAAWPFIVVMPQKPDADKQWEDYDGAVMDMLDAAKKEYKIDEDRVYLTGLSQGGHGAWALGGLHRDVWAAVAPICGYGAFGADRGPEEKAANWLASGIRDLPVWAFHGEADDVVKPAHTRAIEEALKTLGAKNAKFSYYPGVNHNSWDRAYREEKAEGGLAAWFLAHTRKKP